MSHITDDLRVAFRRFRHQPAFTAVVVLTLAMGLGANTAIFALVDTLLLRSLPVERPDELYRLGDSNNCCVNPGCRAATRCSHIRLMEHLRANADAFVELPRFRRSRRLPSAARRRTAASGSAERAVRQRQLFPDVRRRAPPQAACCSPTTTIPALHRPSS